ncbi:hypothetical protein SELMODRAFT_427813 [Selaginella moellendorffii]|uniref:Uncharacterized protein n=1 Tax=Selaginella moellendorffii TaxID=88036 RepID=D8T0S9_SELML|nr:uncharacterized protein LOC9630307 [Selaginella moellendorffii]EFJ09758.1 hypothetical protein SELMODRAFT_427813 [Selaginella moellendorffii]|eukprot:XP_002989164.1 uncharacterized protein LOC9630307 [Selaginella moellendorffii]
MAEEVLAMDVEAVSYDFAHYMLHLDAQDIELQVGSGGCTFVLDFSEVKEFTSPASAAKEMVRNQKFLPTGALGEEEVGYKLWTKFSRGYEALARAAGVLDKAQKFLAVLCDETRRLRLA